MISLARRTFWQILLYGIIATLIIQLINQSRRPVRYQRSKNTHVANIFVKESSSDRILLINGFELIRHYVFFIFFFKNVLK